MMLAQSLVDSALSSNWFTGLAVVVLGFFLVKYFKRIDTLLDKYGHDISELKSGHLVQSEQLKTQTDDIKELKDKVSKIDGDKIADKIITKMRAASGL